MNLILFLCMPFIALIIMPILLLIAKAKPNHKPIGILCIALAILCVCIVIGWCLYFYKLVHS